MRWANTPISDALGNQLHKISLIVCMHIQQLLSYSELVLYLGYVGCVAGYSRLNVRRACLSYERVGFSLCKTGYRQPTKMCELCMDLVAT